jgi:hypothetical protein
MYSQLSLATNKVAYEYLYPSLCLAIVSFLLDKFKSSLLITLFMSFISQLIFYLGILPAIERRDLKSPVMIMGISISPHSSFSFCSTYFEILLLITQSFKIAMFLQ